ncbi:DEAD/DEAH box helicase, partial [Mycobacterium sp.]|uniref:DEAD/DEAH box helicase n=1 Tax=Mycobacterium sp. TaxID=1785 RepID=UPI003BAF6BBE
MTSNSSFADLGVPARLISNLSARGITDPFPIQVSTLPDTLAGLDVLGRGKTGSGKTLAFSIPLVTRLADAKRRPGHPTGLVLAPTRELATQITAAMEPLAASYGLKVTTIFGGVSQSRQESALRSGVDIVVACPGRLEDLMRQRVISLDAVDITVLDEADHMADLGFLPGVTRILAATPSNGQRLLFSATLDNGVDKLVKRFLRNHVMHSVDEVNSHVAEMTHHVFHVGSAGAKAELVHRLASGTGRRILFMRTKHQARKLARQLTDAGVPSVDLHGNLSQPARDRNLAAFSSGEARVLVATDIAARGVHVDDVQLVVHVDPPAEHKAYLHRSGRTARAGSAGDVVTVVLPEQRRDTSALMRRAGISVAPQQVTAASEPVMDLVGEIAPYQAPAPKTAHVQPDQRSQPRRRPNRGGERAKA